MLVDKTWVQAWALGSKLVNALAADGGITICFRRPVLGNLSSSCHNSGSLSSGVFQSNKITSSKVSNIEDKVTITLSSSL